MNGFRKAAAGTGSRAADGRVGIADARLPLLSIKLSHPDQLLFLFATALTVVPFGRLSGRRPGAWGQSRAVSPGAMPDSDRAWFPRCAGLRIRRRSSVDAGLSASHEDSKGRMYAIFRKVPKIHVLEQ
ncbi:MULTISPECIES: hypothetical protein [Azotobacter]|uniref:hypothetical protein n=1 Tax=Azotobacter TaxID=352 RepID=UPI000A4BEF0F|nr:hypothetical protein [Azotobacter vinelandii]WKN22417.1 hypothetical protein AVAEIV_000389 [Azotobacter vinelandii]